jgi:hypothetical protein
LLLRIAGAIESLMNRHNVAALEVSARIVFVHSFLLGGAMASREVRTRIGVARLLLEEHAGSPNHGFLSRIQSAAVVDAIKARRHQPTCLANTYCAPERDTRCIPPTSDTVAIAMQSLYKPTV